MASIPSTYAGGEKPTAAQWNAPGLGLKAIGITDDNSGVPVLPRVLPYPFLIKAGDPNLQAVAVSGGTLVVGSGKMVIIRQYSRGPATTTNPTITPAGTTWGGHGAIQIMTPTSRVPFEVFWVLGPGDTLTTGSNDRALGFQVSVDTTVTPICKALTSATTAYSSALYTVPAGKLFIPTAIVPTAGQTGQYLTLGGNPFLDADEVQGRYRGTGDSVVIPNHTHTFTTINNGAQSGVYGQYPAGGGNELYTPVAANLGSPSVTYGSANAPAALTPQMPVGPSQALSASHATEPLILMGFQF